jgi:Fe-S oxidoreductase
MLPPLPSAFFVPANQHYEPETLVREYEPETLVRGEEGKASSLHGGTPEAKLPLSPSVNPLWKDAQGIASVASPSPPRRDRASPRSPLRATCPSPLRTTLFAGCIMSTVFAETDRATLRVLLAHRCTVSIPAKQGCCGALTIHAGDMDGARVMARRNIEAFERSGIDYIIVNAAGCGAALKEYAYLLRDDVQFAERAAQFSARVRDISEYLAEIPAVPIAHPLNMRVTYQEPCHLAHAQRITQAPRQLLKRIPSLEIVEMSESSLCCGSAGIYNLTQPAMSRRLRERKIQHTMETGAEVVITANPGCQLQLASGLRHACSGMRVMHIVDVLDQAYRLHEFDEPASKSSSS